MQNNFLQLGLQKLNLSTIFFINLFLILGITCQRNNLPVLILVSLLSLICSLYACYIKDKLDNSFIYPIAFLIGALLYQNQQSNFSSFINEYCKKQFDVIAVIQDITIAKSNKKKLMLNVSKITHTSQWQNTNQTIKLTLDQKADISNLQISDEIKINNLFFKFPNSFLRDNLLKEEISAYTTTKYFSYEFIKKPTYSFNRFFKNLRNKIFARLKEKMSKETFALFSSVFLGNKSVGMRTLSQFKKKFNNWGLAHYLARSGLHLVVIFLAWFFIISIFPISFIIKQIIIFFIIFVYSLLSWSSIPFIRSLITFTLYKICIIFNLQINTLHCLNLACLIMLLINPIQLFFLDFQLSFVLTFALIWINSFNLNQ
ncbi:MAG: ComEC/Rec2 family competence protein [Candidatus Babeliales bacterium]|nr:ComEC/Rec2 family competence protein [Candidatus Babeliales bacterium]